MISRETQWAAAIFMWIQIALCLWLLSSRFDDSFRWFLWTTGTALMGLPVALWYLRWWPISLLNKSQTAEELRDRMRVAETYRLGGRIGTVWYHATSWITLLYLAVDVYLYAKAAWNGFTLVKLADANANWWVLVVGIWIAGIWILYYIYLAIFRGTILEGADTNPQRGFAFWNFPANDSLIKNREEAEAFLEWFSLVCPLAKIEKRSYISIPFQAVPSAGLAIAKLFVAMIGLYQTVVPFINTIAALVLAWIVVTVSQHLFVETEQWLNPNVLPCRYRPVLRLVQFVRNRYR